MIIDDKDDKDDDKDVKDDKADYNKKTFSVKGP